MTVEPVVVPFVMVMQEILIDQAPHMVSTKANHTFCRRLPFERPIKSIEMHIAIWRARGGHKSRIPDCSIKRQNAEE